jgi:mannosyltransferase
MDVVIATSQRTSKYVRRPSLVIPHGIDLNAFCPCPDRGSIRQKLQLPPGCLIGCFGRIRAQKGTDLFVEAMINLLPLNPGVIALVMGRTTSAHKEYLVSLRNRVSNAGLEDRVLFLPEVPVDQMPDWYRALDIYVAPQRWEGFGLTPLEAMACGVPVVATRVGAFEEQLIDGEMGFLVEPDDSNSIVRACEAILASTELRHRFSVAARSHVESCFSIDKEASALNALYGRLLQSAPA